MSERAQTPQDGTDEVPPDLAETTPDPRAAIAALEAAIEEQFQAAERCRRIDLVAKAAVGAGAVLLVAVAAGGSRLGATALVFGVTAVLGGLALLGSNRRTLDDTLAAIQANEARRAALIDALGARTVEAE